MRLSHRQFEYCQGDFGASGSLARQQEPVMFKNIAILVVVALISSCTSNQSRIHYVDYDLHERRDDGFNFQEQGPIEFIQMLRSRAEQPGAYGFPYVFSVQGTHYGWVRADDVPKLIELLDSNEPAAAVKMSVSSWMDTHFSTVGHEAANLIEGFRKGQFPHALNSTRWQFANELEQRRFKQWCDRFMQSYDRARAPSHH